MPNRPPHLTTTLCFLRKTPTAVPRLARKPTTATWSTRTIPIPIPSMALMKAPAISFVQCPNKHAPFANDRLRPATPYSSTSENLTIFRNRSSSLEKSKILLNQISFAQPLLQKFQVQDSPFEDMTTAKCKSGLPPLAKIIGFAQIQAAV